MSLLNKSSSAIDNKLSSTRKAKTLNPDAAEFVPFALRPTNSTPDKPTLKRSESSVSNNSDDEAHQFWRHQLPDDIIPDFNVMGEEELSSPQGINSIPFSTLSVSDVNGTSSFSNFHKDTTFAKPWDINGDQLLAGIIDEPPPYNGDHVQGYIDDILNEQQMEGTDVNSLGFLASQFPGFAAESLAEVFYANGCDLNLTIEMLTQLEVDNGLNQNLNSKALSAPNLSALDLPGLSPTNNHHHIPPFSGHDHNISSYRSLKVASSHDSSIWKYDGNPSPTSTIGSSRSPHGVASGYGGGRGGSGERLVNRGSTRSSPFWLEMGDPVANMYSEMRGEACDHTRLRNVYFEQARQAHLVGHKALAKELKVKGQLHHIQLKAAHESIYHQRNSVRGEERIIDLHGLPLGEAIHVLKRDLMMWRSIARSAEQGVQVYICVGTGQHHMKGMRTPARVAGAVQRYLVEEEGVDYSEPQPGLLRVVLY